MGIQERPILFSGLMVQAILEGRKTQTRRVIKPQPTPWRPDDVEDVVEWQCKSRGTVIHSVPSGLIPFCPYGEVGDRLWVRETFGLPFGLSYGRKVLYRADGCHTPDAMWSWRPSIHMPRWASRLTLEIIGVRVERIQDISEADVKAEGCEYLAYRCADEMRPNDPSEFSDLWDIINEKRGFGWAANPWVWVVEFRVI